MQGMHDTHVLSGPRLNYQALIQVFQAMECSPYIQNYLVLLSKYATYPCITTWKKIINTYLPFIVVPPLLCNCMLWNLIGQVAAKFLEKLWVRRVVSQPSGETAEWWNSRVVKQPGGENAVVRAPWWERRVVKSPGIGNRYLFSDFSAQNVNCVGIDLIYRESFFLL